MGCRVQFFMCLNREYLAPQIRSMNNRFHSEDKLPWSYDYPLANHIATNKSYANREMPVFAPLPFFRVSSENCPAQWFKILPIGILGIEMGVLLVVVCSNNSIVQLKSQEYRFKMFCYSNEFSLTAV